MFNKFVSLLMMVVGFATTYKGFTTDNELLFIKGMLFMMWSEIVGEKS